MNRPFSVEGARVWVTGGNGFLGRVVVRELSARGADVLAPSSRECDLLQAGAAEAYVKAHRPDAVVHLAARVGGIGANRKHPGGFFHDNLMMGVQLIEACRVAGTRKVLVVGTVCAYPKYCSVPFREDDLWNGFPEETNAPYGIAKKALLTMLHAYRQEYGLNGIFLLPVNLYGPGDSLDLEHNHVIPALIRKFIEAQRTGAPSVELWGTGSASREFLFVEDAAIGIGAALAHYDEPEPVNLGSGCEISIRELAQRVQRLVGFTGDVVFNPAYPDGQPRRCLDTRRALERFGWKAETSLDAGLERTVAWARSALGG